MGVGKKVEVDDILIGDILITMVIIRAKLRRVRVRIRASSRTKVRVKAKQELGEGSKSKAHVFAKGEVKEQGQRHHSGTGGASVR